MGTARFDGERRVRLEDLQREAETDMRRDKGAKPGAHVIQEAAK